MFKFIISFYVILILFKITIGLIHLIKENLNLLCECKSSETTIILLFFKNIATVHPSTFDGLNSLQEIRLSNNQLTTIHLSTFNGLNSLQYLYLYNNRLTTIDPSTFIGLNSLQELSLSNNQLTTIDPSTFIGLN